MATAPDLDLIEEEAPEGLTILDILANPGENLAAVLPETELAKIGQRVVEDVERDLGSRGDWEDVYDRSVEIAMQVRKEKSFPWPNAANVKYPLLTVASIQFQARAYPAIVDGSNLVKGRVLGPDPTGEKRARADRIGQHMTWQLLYRMPGWEEETDRLLLMLPIMGCVFRKTWFDPVENANRSEIVSGKDFIIDYWAKSIESAPRYTQRLRYYPYEVSELIASEQWLPIAVDQDQDGKAQQDDEDGLVEFYEQHRLLDLDGDGFPEHYVVTANKDGEVARIVPCFGPENVKVAIAGQVLRLDELPPEALGMIERVVKIDRRQYFTKYSFIPAPDGSFYDIGFGALLYSISETIDTSLNQMLDAGALQNANGGFLGSGVNVRGGNFNFRLGEWKRVDVTGGMLKDNIVPLNAPGPSAVLFNLLGLLIESAKEITSVQDVMVGEGTANQPATTTLALIEQGTKVMSSIFKRIWRSFGQELRIMRRLNRDYLDEEEYFQLNDAEEAVQVGREDYADEDLDVIPVADPNQVSDMQKLTKAQAMMEVFNGDPLINQQKIRQNMLEALGARDIPAYFEVPPPQPDPKIMVDMGKVENQRKGEETKAVVAMATAADKFASAAERLAAIGLLPDAAILAAEAVEEGVSGDIEQPGRVPGMEGPPGDEGVPGAAPGAPMPPDGGMGGGGGIDPGAAGASGPVGPAFTDQVPGGGPI